MKCQKKQKMETMTSFSLEFQINVPTKRNQMMGVYNYIAIKYTKRHEQKVGI